MARTGSMKADPKHVPREDWETPLRIVEYLSGYCGAYDLDVCAQKVNAKAPRWINRSRNGLKQPWECLNAWCNPPYGKRSSDWVIKAVEETKIGRCRNATVLLPGNITDRIMFHEWILPHAVALIFFKGRIAFEYKGIAYPGSDISNMAVLFQSADEEPGEIHSYWESPASDKGIVWESDGHPWIFSASARIGL